jgi:hypothetical protein
LYEIAGHNYMHREPRMRSGVDVLRTHPYRVQHLGTEKNSLTNAAACFRGAQSLDVVSTLHSDCLTLTKIFKRTTTVKVEIELTQENTNEFGGI